MGGFLDDPEFGAHRVPANDIDAAVAYVKKRGRAMTAEEWSVIYRKQDDPQELARRLRQAGLAPKER